MAIVTLHTIWFVVYRCVCSPTFASVLCIAQLCTHCATVLLCRSPLRWWLKVTAGSYGTSLLPSSPTEEAKGVREMKGEVVFRRDTNSNLLKAVSGTEWMYRRGALERGRRVTAPTVCCVCVSSYTYAPIGLITNVMGVHKFLQYHRETNNIERRPGLGRPTMMTLAMKALVERQMRKNNEVNDRAQRSRSNRARRS